MAEQASMRDVVARATRDAEFRGRFMHDPHGTLKKEFNIDLPADLEIAVLEDGPERVHIVLPPLHPAAVFELADDELDEVAGGYGQPDSVAYCWTGNYPNPAYCRLY